MGERFFPRIIRSRDLSRSEIEPIHARYESDAERIKASQLQSVRSKLEDESFRRGFVSAWSYCESVWDQEPYVCAWCWLIKTLRRPAMPYAATLHDRLVFEFADDIAMIAAKTLDPSSLVSGNAIQCLEGLPALLPQQVFERMDEVTLRDWLIEHVTTVGDWARLVYERGREDA